MKLRINRSLRLALLASFALLHPHTQANTILMAEGVNASDISSSSRFYDTGKGSYGFGSGGGAVSAAKELYNQSGNFNFLGELEGRLVSTSSFEGRFANMTDDDMTCWAQASSNIIQYWHSYYGVFYNGSRDLPYGYTYDKSLLSDLDGTLSLRMNLQIMDNVKNVGGNLMRFAEWFLQGVDDAGYFKTTGQGGYWKSFFTEGDPVTLQSVSTLSDITNHLLPALGYTKNSSGTYTRTNKGLIAELSINRGEPVGHALTCYGVTLGSNGMVKSIYIADSDDKEYRLTELFVRYTNNRLELYRDAAFSQPYGWYVNEVKHLNTPEKLKSMLSQYENKSNALYWTGKSPDKIWHVNAQLNCDTLPGNDSAWKVSVNGTYYPIRNSANRSVVFNDTASGATSDNVVRIYPKGNGNVSALSFTNTKYYYALFGDNNNITAESITVSGGNAAQFNDLTLHTNNATVSNGWVTLASGAKWTGVATINSGGGLVLSEGRAALTTLTFESGSFLNVLSDSTLSAEWTEMKGPITLRYVANEAMPLLSIPGGLRSWGDAKFAVEISGDYPEMEVPYPIVDFERDITNWNVFFSTSTGELTYRDNIIYYTWLPALHTWNEKGDIWSATKLGTETVDTNNSRIAFNSSGSKAVSISGYVSPIQLIVNNSGSLSLTGKTASSRITGKTKLVKRGSGVLTLSTNNSYTGGSIIEDGNVVLKSSSGLGSSRVEMKGGILNMGGYAVSNPLVVDGNVTIRSAASYKGILTLNGGSIGGNPINISGVVSLRSGTVNNVLQGPGGINKSDKGTVQLNGLNTFKGQTNLYGGTLVAGSNSALSTGWITMTGGSLDMNGKSLSNTITKSSGVSDLKNAGNFKGNLTMNGGTLNVKNGAFRATDLTLNGGLLSIEAPQSLKDFTPITIGGKLKINSQTSLKLDSDYAIGSYVLVNWKSFSGNVNYLNLLMPNSTIYDYALSSADGKLTLNVSSNGNVLYWKGSGTWAQDRGSCWYLNNGSRNVPFSKGDMVYFANGGNVAISSQVSPGSMSVSGSGTLTFSGATPTAGSIAGAANMTKTGTGTLQVNLSNKNWRGNIYLQGGKIVIGAYKALGSCSVHISNATLDMGGRTTEGSINLTGASSLLKGTAFNGNMTVNGTLNSGSVVNIASGKTATLRGGTICGTISGTGTTTVSGAVKLSGGKIATGKLNISGTGASLNVTSGGLFMNTTASDIAITNGASLSSVGSVSARSLSLSGNSRYSVKNAVAKNMTLTKGLSATNSTIVHHGAISAASISLNGSSLTHTGGGNGVKVSGSLTMSNGSDMSIKGPLSTGFLTLSGNSTINTVDTYSRNVTLSGSISLTDSDAELYGNIQCNFLTLKDSDFKLNGAYTRTITLNGSASLTNSVLELNGYLSGKNMTLSGGLYKQKGGGSGLKLSGNLNMSNSANLSLNAPLNAASATISGNSHLNMKNSVQRNLSLSGSMSVTDSKVSMYGNFSASNLTMKNAVLDAVGSAESKFTVQNSASLTNSRLNIYGYMSAAKLTLNKATLYQKSQNFSGMKVSGNLSMNSGSSLTVDGTLHAGSMTLSGGALNINSTVEIANKLTLNAPIDLNFKNTLSLTPNVEYRIIDYKSSNLSATSNLAYLLGLQNAGCTLKFYTNAICLTVVNSSEWKRFLSECMTAFKSAEGGDSGVGMEPDNSNSTSSIAMDDVADEIDEDGKDEISEEAAVSSASPESGATEAVTLFDRSGADALVQSNWGMLNASRAFTDTIGNRASNRRTLGEEQKSSVWMSAMGASSRLSSDGVAAGSDYNLFGAAFGMEQQLTEKSSLGLAIGNSRGKVSSFTSGRTKQDTLHTALYGQHLLQQSTSDALTLDWSAAYGRTESRWNGIEWDQRALQLDARATYAHQLNDKTTVSAFAGLQYYASDSATVAKGCESGSIQNLRGEIGVGIGHRATSKTSIYGELSFVGDMARNNPTATIGEYRVRGANPGRAGINFSVGGTHALNDRWSVNANYNLELMERANSHSANIGTSYKF